MSKQWSTDEIAALKAHYKGRGAMWGGWDKLLKGRSCGSIYAKASKLGLRYEAGTAGITYVQVDPKSCQECIYFRHLDDERGMCMERHAVGLFQGAPNVKGFYDARICPHRCGQLVRAC